MYGEDIAIISVCLLILVLVVFFNSCHLHHSEENHRIDSSYLIRIIEILEQEEEDSKHKRRNLPQQHFGSLPLQERRPVQSVREGEVPGPLRQAGLHPVTQTVRYTTLPLQSERRGVSSFQSKGGKSVQVHNPRFTLCGTTR